MNQLLVAIAFFIVASFVIFFRNNEQSRRVFLIIFFLLVLVPGLTGRTSWPFFSWHLYGIQQDDTFKYYEMRVSDGAGNELKYDARAVRPSLATPIRRYAAQIASADPNDQTELLKFFLEEAQEYQGKLEQSPPNFFRFLKFPDHQYGYRWPDAELSDLGPIESIKIYKVDADLTNNGQDIESLYRELVIAYPEHEP